MQEHYKVTINDIEYIVLASSVEEAIDEAKKLIKKETKKEDK
jgi:hypothetical protein